MYFDPPYHPRGSTSSFTSYAKNGFGTAEQTDLRDLCLSLHARRVKVMLSNSDTAFIRGLYGDLPFYIETVQAPRMVNSNPNARGAVNEVLICNFRNEARKH